MDVNLSADVKGYGNLANQTSVPVVEQEDRVKPQIQPVVKADTDSGKVKLNDQALHGRGKEEQAKKMSREEIEKVMAVVQERLDAIGSNLKLGLREYEETNDIVVQVKDRKSDEVVKQFPSEELLKLQAKLNDLIGVLLDKKA
jgi:flagellar protein FlaG